MTQCSSIFMLCRSNARSWKHRKKWGKTGRIRLKTSSMQIRLTWCLLLLLSNRWTPSKLLHTDTVPVLLSASQTKAAVMLKRNQRFLECCRKQHRVPIQTWWTEFSSDKMLCWHFLEVSYHTNWDHLMQLIIGSSSVLVSVLCGHASHQPLAFLSERKLLTKTELLLIQRVQISHMISTLIQHHTQNKNGQSSKVIWIF